MSDLSKVCSRLGDDAAGYVMGARLDDLAGYWLELSCCGDATFMPCLLLARQRRVRQPGQPDRSEQLRDLLPRMRCKQCAGSPKTVCLTETPNRQKCHGLSPGWSVQLVPVPATMTA